MIPDKLLINLKIISKIQKNGRISRSYDGIISLESDVFYQSIKRFMLSDSRKQAIFEINSVITESIDMLNHIINSKHMNKNYSQTSEYVKNCENINLIITEMESAKLGIENLKFTYQNDPNTASQLDILILKINTTLRDIGQKLFYFQTFLPNNITNTNFEKTNNEHIFHDLTSIHVDNQSNSEDNNYLNMENI